MVDRKDLDRQTREEFNKFQNGCVEENTNTETLVRRMLSEDYADKVIVTTIQKLGLALDENSRRNQSKIKDGKQTFKERLAPLSDKRVVFIFDECHRSQFGDNHQAIKSFFPKAQLFGFTGTPIFEENSSYTQIDGTVGSFKTTKDIFENQLHAYTITHAIEDKNVLSFHIDYFGKAVSSAVDAKIKKVTPPPAAVIQEILAKHDAATNQRRFNAILATASINDAIDYVAQFKIIQAQKQAQDEAYNPLNIACVFSPPAHIVGEEKDAQADKNIQDIHQIQEDLQQEKADNQVEPEQKKSALINIINDYNAQYGSNHSINEFDAYYKDVQQRIKDHKYTNAEFAHHNKVDIVIVVDMLLTGFDAKYLNTLYVDKNLKYHGLIQAFSRTNRVLNDSKPWGNILDFRAQQSEVKAAIELFSGADKARAQEIWLVEAAPVVVEQYQTAVAELQTFMAVQGLACTPSEVFNLKGDQAKVEFVQKFKEIQQLKNKLEQYTELDQTQQQAVEQAMPTQSLRQFKGVYLEQVQELQLKQNQNNGQTPEIVEQLEFNLSLFASVLIDYDYIMKLLAQSSQDPGKQKMSRQALIDEICSNANFMDERDDLLAYIEQLPMGVALKVNDIESGYQKFKAEKSAHELAAIAQNHDLNAENLQKFVANVMARMIFDGEQLNDLFVHLDLGWKERGKRESALMEDLSLHLKKLAKNREISGLAVYD